MNRMKSLATLALTLGLLMGISGASLTAPAAHAAGGFHP
jgi:hypothetical protein